MLKHKKRYTWKNQKKKSTVIYSQEQKSKNNKFQKNQENHSHGSGYF